MADHDQDGASASQARRGRPLRRAALALAALAISAPPAAAENLNLDTGQRATLSGVVTYDIVYVDNGGRLELAGDTHILARQVYIGAGANLLPCWTAGGDNTCTAGRNLTISATEGIVVARNIDLRAAGAAPVRPAGSLVVAGSSVSIGGAITTTGVGAPSGTVEITAASGGVSTEAITAPGASVKLMGPAGVTVAGDLQLSTAGFAVASPAFATQPPAGSATLASSAGDVAVLGSVLGSGINGTAELPVGGNAGTLTASGAAVALGAVTLRPGAGVNATAGAPGSLTVNASASATMGAVDLSGAVGTPPAPGGTVAITAGTLAATGTVNVNGAAHVSSGAGARGGSIAVTTGSGAFGAMQASGANSNGAGSPGAAAGSISIAGTGGIATGALTANGGNAGAGADGAAGGAVSVQGHNVTTGAVNANAGTTSRVGAAGGQVRLWADGNLSVGSGTAVSVSASASTNAAAITNPGGPGGTVLLRAAAGVLRAGGVIRANGGPGGPAADPNRAGEGGNGGSIDLVAADLGSIGGIFAIGGNAGSGTAMGPTANRGGSGGTVRVWSSDIVFGGETGVNTTGGNGFPAGPDGPQVQESAPAGLAVDPATGALSFRTDSPDAQGYRVFRSLAGGPLEAVMDTGASSGVVPPEVPICTDVAYSVQAFHAGVGWLSAVAGPAGWQRQPSATQGCADAPPVVVGKRLRVKLKALKRSKWKLNVQVTVNGVGSLSARLMPRKVTKKTKPFVTVTRQVASGGRIKLAIVFPKNARKAGKLAVHFETRALLGSAARRGAVNVEVLK